MLSLNINNRKRRRFFSSIRGVAGLAYECVSAYLNWKENKAIEKGYQDMQSDQKLLKSSLYLVSQEPISYGTYEIETLTVIMVTVMGLNNRTTAVERVPLNRTLYYDMG